MGNTTTKAAALMRNLQRELVQRFPSTYVFVNSTDTDGNPVLRVSADATPATTEQVILIRIKPEELLFVNAIGTAQENFVPHILDVATELGAGVNVTYLNASNAAIMHTAAAKVAAIYKFYLSPNGAIPALTDMVAANLNTVTLPDLYNKLTAQ